MTDLFLPFWLAWAGLAGAVVVGLAVAYYALRGEDSDLQ
jgi:hypothetical protein